MFSGVRFKTNLTGSMCERCGETFVGYDALAAFELAVAVETVRAGLRDGATFRFQRKALGHSLSQVAEMFDVDPGTVSAWEANREAIPTSALIAMGALVLDHVHGHTDTLNHIKALGRPIETGERVMPDIACPSLAVSDPA